MKKTLANLIQTVLRGLGIRTIDKQFLFSYSLIALFTQFLATGLLAFYPSYSTDP